MSNREIHGFFYGLFMDEEVLIDYEILPRDPIRAYVDNYKLYIGKRLNLLFISLSIRRYRKSMQ